MERVTAAIHNADQFNGALNTVEDLLEFLFGELNETQRIRFLEYLNSRESEL